MAYATNVLSMGVQCMYSCQPGIQHIMATLCSCKRSAMHVIVSSLHTAHRGQTVFMQGACNADLKPQSINSCWAVGVKRYCRKASAATRVSGFLRSMFLSTIATGNSICTQHAYLLTIWPGVCMWWTCSTDILYSRLSAICADHRRAAFIYVSVKDIVCLTGQIQSDLHVLHKS